MAVCALHEVLELFGFSDVAGVEGFSDVGDVLPSAGVVGLGVWFSAPEGYVVEGYSFGGGVTVDYAALSAVADYECFFEEVGGAVEGKGGAGGGAMGGAMGCFLGGCWDWGEEGYEADGYCFDSVFHDIVGFFAVGNLLVVFAEGGAEGGAFVVAPWAHAPGGEGGWQWRGVGLR